MGGAWEGEERTYTAILGYLPPAVASKDYFGLLFPQSVCLFVHVHHILLIGVLRVFSLHLVFSL